MWRFFHKGGAVALILKVYAKQCLSLEVRQTWEFSCLMRSVGEEVWKAACSKIICVDFMFCNHQQHIDFWFSTLVRLLVLHFQVLQWKQWWREWRQLRKCCTQKKYLHCSSDLWFEMCQFQKHEEICPCLLSGFRSPESEEIDVQATRDIPSAYFICVYNQPLKYEGISMGKSATEKGSSNNSHYK